MTGQNNPGKPTFSVIIPIYNGARWLGETLSSVGRQSFADYELILVDDASTDESPDICVRYCEAEPAGRARLIKKSLNEGTYLARVDGIAAARGEYLVFADSDDLMHPDELKYLNKLISEERPDIVRFKWGNRADFAGPGLGNFRIPAGLYAGDDMGVIREESARGHIMMVTPLAVLRDIAPTEHEDELRHLTINEDWLLAARVIGRAESLMVTDDVLYMHREHPGSVTFVWTADKARAQYRSWRFLADEIVSWGDTYGLIWRGALLGQAWGIMRDALAHITDPGKLSAAWDELGLTLADLSVNEGTLAEILSASGLKSHIGTALKLLIRRHYSALKIYLQLITAAEKLR